MQISDFLNQVCEQIKYKPVRKDIAEELNVHIEDLKEEFINNGIDEVLAEDKAIKQMGDAEEIGKKLNKIHKPKFDWKLVLIVTILLCFGFLVSYTRTTRLSLENDESNYIIQYILSMTIGVICGISIYFLDYRKILKYSNYMYILATVIIIGTSFIEIKLNGISNLRMSTIYNSISVVATLLYIISFIGFLINIEKSKIQRLINNKGIKLNFNLFKIIILSIISLLMLCCIPSLVSAVILLVVYLILATVKILNIEKNKKRNIAILWGIPIFLGIILIFMICLESPYRIQRFTSGFNPEKDPQGSGWVGINRKLILDSAQSFGEAENMSNALYMFDEGTNFAFISILAHYGWFISISMIIAIILLSIKLIINSMKIKDLYGKLLTIGISTMFIMESVFNLLMNLNIGIEANFNIPFISYGRIELIINLMSLALVLSTYKMKDIVTLRKDNIE